MSIRGSRGQLSRATRDLLLHWDRTRDTWRDSRAQEFEVRVLEPLRSRVQGAATAMDRMVGNLKRARRECSRISDT
jgi:hypothetical protein